MKRDFFYVIGAFILLGAGIYIAMLINESVTGENLQEEVLSTTPPVSLSPTVSPSPTVTPTATPEITEIPLTPTQFPMISP